MTAIIWTVTLPDKGSVKHYPYVNIMIVFPCKFQIRFRAKNLISNFYLQIQVTKQNEMRLVMCYHAAPCCLL
jgi:hypothetical protein